MPAWQPEPVEIPVTPPPSPGRGVGAVLAAGAGRRFTGEGPKVLAPLPDGTTLLGRALAAAAGADLDGVAVVVGTLSPVELGPLPAGVTVLVNPRWTEGQASSLQVAVDWARAQGAPALTMGLGDQPGLTASAWAAVAAAADTPIAVATYGGSRGHPVRLGSEIWSLLPRSGDHGARRLLRDRPDLVAEVSCLGDPTDIDTRDDLTRWVASDGSGAPDPGRR